MPVCQTYKSYIPFKEEGTRTLDNSQTPSLFINLQQIDHYKTEQTYKKKSIFISYVRWMIVWIKCLHSKDEKFVSCSIKSVRYRFLDLASLQVPLDGCVAKLLSHSFVNDDVNVRQSWNFCDPSSVALKVVSCIIPLWFTLYLILL